MTKEQIKEYTARVAQANRTELVVIIYELLLDEIQEGNKQYQAEIRMRGKNRSAKRRDIYKNFSEVWTFAMKLRCNYDSCIVMSTNS